MDENKIRSQLEHRWYVVGPPWGDGTYIVSGSEDPHVGIFVADCSNLAASDDELREFYGDAVVSAYERAERIVDDHNKTLDALEKAEARAIELETQLVPLQQQFDDWAEQNRRAGAWAAAWKRKAKEFRDWYFYAEKHIFRSQELSQRVKELEATNAPLREIVTRTQAYLDVKKTWDNRLPELIDLKRAIDEMEGAT